MSHLAVRPPAVAGFFYPGQPDSLRGAVVSYLAQAGEAKGPAPKAVIVPHAGYVYSAAIAATAYARLGADADNIKRVVLLGPAHRVFVRGLAAPEAKAFATPLGSIAIDEDALAAVADLPQVIRDDRVHEQEHSLEVQLPFLQRGAPKAKLVPFAVGDARPGEVAEVIERLWGGPETRIVISSDLSHFHSYDIAQRTDAATAAAIERFDAPALGPEDACGCLPIAGLLKAAKPRGLTIERLDLRNSGDTAGPRDRVVGYGAWALS
jgi:AmmeMemoRadiSam system protein B